MQQHFLSYMRKEVAHPKSLGSLNKLNSIKLVGCVKKINHTNEGNILHTNGGCSINNICDVKRAILSRVCFYNCVSRFYAPPQPIHLFWFS